MKKVSVLILMMVFVACSTVGKKQEIPVEKKKPTKEEMCKDPNTKEEVLKLFCN
jgi:hypothetical protein